MAEKKEKQYVSDNAQLMAEWDWEKNNELNISPYSITYGSHKEVWWKCAKGHSWPSIVSNRTRLGRGCPYCAGQKPIVGENDLCTTHPELVKRLFESEVTEVREGIVEIKSISREAGSRTKIAVWTNDKNVDPIGACIGAKGTRVQNIVDELGGEKIDIVRYSEDAAEFIKASLNPAEVVSIEVNAEEKEAHVVVPFHQLSLAIGKEGQNARLAARLTGYKIDIKSDAE